MRRLAWFAIACSITACGGGGTDPVTPPPPPPATILPGPPASLSISGGDNQQTDPGGTVGAAVAVVVRDASGHPVPGVTVAFSVDSGGGSLSGTTATSGADGVASAGGWRLGPVEGRNTLLATAAGLPPVKFAAMAVYATVTLTDVPVPTSGGAVTVTRPGSPFDGLRLDIPAGSFSTPTEIRLIAGSGASVPHVSGVEAGSPLITIESDGDSLSKQPMTIHFPGQVPAGFFPVLSVVNQAGFVAALPTLDFDATGVTASLRRLDPAGYAASTAAAFRAPGWAAAAGGKNQVQMIMYLVPWQFFTLDKNTGFLPGRDDWEFPNTPTDYYKFTGSGEVVTERWVYQNHKIGQLNGAFQDVPGINVSSFPGLQWTAVQSESLDNDVGPSIAAGAARQAVNRVKYDTLTARWAVSAMWLSGGAPQTLALTDGLRNGTVLAYAWKASTREMLVADPYFPGDNSRVIGFPATGMVPYVGSGGVTFGTAIMGVDQLVSARWLSADWPKVLNGTINASDFTRVFLGSRSTIVGDTLFMAEDTTRIWFSCPQSECSWGYDTQLPISAGNLLQSQLVYANDGSGAWSLFSAKADEGVGFDFSQFAKPSTTPWADWEFGVAPLTLDDAGQPTRWDSWYRMRVIHFGFAVKPVHGKPGQQLTLDIKSLGGPDLPDDARYEWDFHDGTALAVGKGLKTVNHTWAKNGQFPVTLKVFHGTADKLIAKTTSSAMIGDNKLVGVAAGLVDGTYPFYYSVGAFPVGTKFTWTTDNGRNTTSTVMTNDSTFSLSVFEIGTYKVKVSAVDPLGNSLGVDSLLTTITSTHPWGVFHITSLNASTTGIPSPLLTSQGLPDRTRALYDSDVLAFQQAIGTLGTTGFPQLYLVFIPRDSSFQFNTARWAKGLYLYRGGTPLPRFGPSLGDLVTQLQAPPTGNGNCGIITDDPKLQLSYSGPTTSVGTVKGVYPLRLVVGIGAPGCGNVNTEVFGAGTWDVSLNPADATGSFTYTYRMPSTNGGADKFRWTYSGTFSAVRVR